MADGVTFALPSIGSSGMAKDEQGALVVNQATAVIVAAYLDYLARVYPTLAANASSVSDISVYRIHQNEIGALVDSVQDALKSF